MSPDRNFSGEPDRTPGKADFSSNISGTGRDTTAGNGVLAVNGLAKRSGHASGQNILSKYMKAEHKRMSRMLGYCLTLDTPEAWAAFRFVAQVRMSEGERAMLAYFALTSLAPDDAEMTASAAFGSAGDPLPPFLGGMDEARSWAGWASRGELKAYALACFEAMAPKDQAAFFHHISTIEVAA